MSYRSRRLLRRLALAVPLVTIASVVLASPALAATGLNPLLPNAVSPNGQNIFRLYNWISIPALGIFILVEVMLLTIIIRDRRRRQAPGYVPTQTHGNTRLEIAWTLGPALVIGLIGWFSFNELQTDFLVQGNTIAANQGPTDLAITVSGHQFGWFYTYPEGFRISSEGLDAASNPLVVPTGALVRLTLQSTDVIHGFWVPEIMGKTDLVPGYDNFTWFKISEPGEWRGQCTELCGAGHGTMQIRVKAVTPAEFNAWVTQQKAKAAAAASPRPSPSPPASPTPTAPGSGRPSPSPSPR